MKKSMRYLNDHVYRIAVNCVEQRKAKQSESNILLSKNLNVKSKKIWKIN